MRLDHAIDALRRLAPEHLAEPWDKVGLHVGGPDWSVKRGLLCIDLTPPVLAEAVRRKADLVVAYHPPIFKPIERLTTEHWKTRLLIECVQRRIAVYSPHTALDAAEGGVNDWLAAGVCGGAPGRNDRITVIEPRQPTRERLYKLLTFVPPQHADRLRSALSAAGAGVIGDYTECSFGSPGTGTFKGGAGADPFIGKAGRFETVEELRMEMLISDGAAERELAKVVNVLRDVHPYEEPAFDIYPLQAPPGDDDEPGVGQGRRVALAKPVSAATLIKRIKSHLGCRHVEVASPAGDTAGGPAKVGVVRLCAGAGGSVIGPGSDGADALFTGEMRHHDVLDAVQQGKLVILAGHTQTERPYLPVYRDRLTEKMGKTLQWHVSETDGPPGWIA
jgi:dinuclear metal center YbgI/SA1388 family protein